VMLSFVRGVMEASERGNGGSGGTSGEGWAAGEGEHSESSARLRASEVIRDILT